MSDEDIAYTPQWPAPGEQAMAAVRAFWISLDRLPAREAIDNRARELIMTAQTGQAIVGVATGVVRLVSQLGVPMYHYRTLTSPGTRMRQVGTQLLLRSFAHLQEYNQRLDLPEAVGIYMEIENPQLMRFQNEAIWYQTRFLYVGKTPQGSHQRVRYFEHAGLP